MIVQIKIPDGLFEKYQTYNQASPERAIEQQLTRFQEVKPSDRVLVVPSAQRNELEVLLDSHFASAQELVSKVKDLLKIRVEGVDVTLDPNTLFRVTQQAEFEGMPSSDFMKLKVEEGIKFAVDGGL
jgi:hypothetical protein